MNKCLLDVLTDAVCFDELAGAGISGVMHVLGVTSCTGKGITACTSFRCYWKHILDVTRGMFLMLLNACGLGVLGILLFNVLQGGSVP